MFVLLPVVLFTLFVASCRKEEEPPKKDIKPEEPPPPPKDIFYRRSCLKDEACDWSERQAAIYDYVGAAYGEGGKVQFTETDGTQHLTPAERGSVEKEFGRLTGADQTGPYLSNAHSVFLKRLNAPTPKRCPQDPPVKLSHSLLGDGLVLYGAHGCGEAHGKQLSESGLELAMAADSRGWTFFIEGQEPDPALMKALGDGGKQHELEPEGKMLAHIATALQIPMKEALKYDPTHPHVLDEAAKKSGYRREDLIVGAVFQVLISRFVENPSLDRNQLMTQIVDEYAPYFKINRQKLADEMNDFLKKYGRDQVTEANRRMNQLVEVSNQLSGAALRKELEGLAEKKDQSHHALFLVGAKHLEMVKGTYQDR